MVNYVQRGRDVAHLIQQHGWEKGGAKAMVRIAEDNEMLRQELAQLSKLMEQMINRMGELMTINVNLKERYDQMQRSFHPDNEANPDQKWSK